MKKKICVIITTRGNYAKMKSVMCCIETHPLLELQVILGGMVVLEKYGRILNTPGGQELKVDRQIHFVIEGESPVTMAKSAGIAVSEFATAFENLKPDIVMVIADRFECLPIAMAASYMNIPVAHIEGGEVSGSIDESIRHSITKLAHVHFPASLGAASRIERMGEDPNTIHAVGATSIDVLSEITVEDLLPIKEFQKNWGLGSNIPLIPGKFIIVIQHPVTTEYEKNYDNINETIKAIEDLKMPTAWIWPNMDAGSDGINRGIRWYRERNKPEHIHFFKSLPIELFGPLLNNTACIVGNSSSGIREAAFLGTPCVNVGTRQNGRERGRNVIDVGYDSQEILEAIGAQLAHGKFESDHIYGNGMSGNKIVDILSTIEFNMQKQITY
jgi:GDP/UDP-N,N'-diacetylbacillosamine 2-epimerase (hydrolysing)